MNHGSSALCALETKSCFELRELLARQEKILKNKSFVDKLKDKGSKLLATRERIEKALTEAEERESAATSSLEDSQLVSESNDLELEWTLNTLGTLDLCGLDDQSSRSGDDISSNSLNVSATESESTSSEKTDNHSSPTSPSPISCSTSPNKNNASVSESGLIRRPNFTDEMRHAQKYISKTEKLPLKEKFKPNHLYPSTSEVKTKSLAQLARQSRWDEALHPPSEHTVKKMSWEESLVEIHDQYSKRKDLEADAKSSQNRPYAFKDMPSSSQNLSVASKKSVTFARDRDCDDDFLTDDEESDRITEESDRDDDE